MVTAAPADALPCPACGAPLVTDLIGHIDGVDIWPEHGGDDPLDDEDRACPTSWRAITTCPPRDYPPGTKSAWPSMAMRVALAMARAWYRRPACDSGGEYHVVLDDGYIEAAWVEGSRDRCIATNDDVGVELGQRLLGLTQGQRWWVYSHTHHKATFPECGIPAYARGWSIDSVTYQPARAVIEPWAAHLSDYFDNRPVPFVEAAPAATPAPLIDPEDDPHG